MPVDLLAPYGPIWVIDEDREVFEWDERFGEAPRDIAKFVRNERIKDLNMKLTSAQVATYETTKIYRIGGIDGDGSLMVEVDTPNGIFTGWIEPDGSLMVEVEDGQGGWEVEKW